MVKLEVNFNNNLKLCKIVIFGELIFFMYMNKYKYFNMIIFFCLWLFYVNLKLVE